MTSSPGMGRSANLVYALGPPPLVYNSPTPKADYKSPPPPYFLCQEFQCDQGYITRQSSHEGQRYY
ncbi:BnaC07g13060D [Brassica napus]|uniref:Extensin domain-containing protein n=2 Tax=Brassica TaxID=3705 RepID=A0A3P6ELA4_BRAOL|nr:unnamed protein product [Brassica napus]CDY28478.1 BnaC07g13060D [Brassica napus]VDD36991.1 unnamed protein product [Brassica oleracea]